MHELMFQAGVNKRNDRTKLARIIHDVPIKMSCNPMIL